MPKQPVEHSRHSCSDDALKAGSASAATDRRCLWNTMIAWALVAAWAAFIFYMSAHTDSDLNEGDDLVAHVKRWLNAIQLQLFGEGVDAVSSLAHFCEYTVFGALLANAVGKRASAKQLMVFGVAVGIASAYAVTDEVHQLFVPDRMCDIVD